MCLRRVPRPLAAPLALAAVLVLAGCGGSEPSHEHDEAGAAAHDHGAMATGEAREYWGEGEYLFHTVGDDLTTVTINHREIPGFMEAMAMPYPLEDLSLVEGLEPGASIRFHVVVREDGDFFIDRIDPVAPTPTEDAAATAHP